MQELEHGWADLGTTSCRYQVASPTGGIMNSLGNIGMPDEEIRVERTGEDTIEVLNIDRREKYTYRWNVNSWVETNRDFI